MNIQDAIDVIESVAGFTDESTPVGEAWLEVLSFIHHPTALSQPEPVAPTDEELSRRFRAWWYDEGSGLPPLPGMDHEEHTRRISEIAWANGAYVARYGTPENEPVAPTDEELLAMRSWSCHGPTFDSDLVDFGHRCYNLGRYGTPAIQPESVAPTDEELLELLSRVSGLPDNDTYIVDGGRIMSEPNELLAFARAVLARWGTPAIAAELEAQ